MTWLTHDDVFSWLQRCQSHAHPEHTGEHDTGPDGGEVPPVWVDRAGAKIAIQETYSRNSKGSLGLVLERVRSSPPCSLQTVAACR